ncbi:LuxR C-terminal-related transcriptional regulator [Dictyobacter kobayashii]|uniref:HTH luxR-type domain-containing protein n=1 Tax=Dictyobacter kobayashii TaxID=2014872 RepID=A0A402AEU1_9CHLR|nr:LuxR C-terminal-related transcriptional regulator [Dictyobacter kobayashii]GCE17637.1 hypothetical protein KDK_14370 [Dictyobacter kobayashii]
MVTLCQKGINHYLSYQIGGNVSEQDQEANSVITDHDELQDIQGEITALDVYVNISQGNVPHSIALAHKALEQLSANNLFMRSTVTLNLGLIYAFSRNVIEAVQAFTEASILSQKMGNVYLAYLTLCSLATMKGMQGQLYAAAKIYQQVLVFNKRKKQPLPYAGMAYVGMGSLLYEWNELETAERHLVDGISLSKQWGNREYVVYGYAMLAAIKHVQGDKDGTLDMLQQAEEQALGQQLPIWVTPLVSTYKVRLLLMQQEVDAANDLAQRSFLGEFENVTLARIHIALKHSKKALDLLDSQLSLLESTGQTRMLLESRMLMSLAYFKQGLVSQSLQMLQDTLLSTQEEGYIRLFVDEGQPMQCLLLKLFNSQQKGRTIPHGNMIWQYIEKLLCAFGKPFEKNSISEQSNALRTSFSDVGIEPLSRREIEVIRYVASGLSNDEIAQSMVVAKSTVQWHIKNIYGKLHIHNRALIVVRARELGLYP